MMSDRNIITDLSLQHLEGEGDYLLSTVDHVGEDDD